MNQLLRVGSRLLVAANTKQVVLREFSTSKLVSRGAAAAGSQVHPGYIKIREKYKFFQTDDGRPIHLKCGLRDQILYYFTWAITWWGLVECFIYAYHGAFPPKPAPAIPEPSEELEEEEKPKGKC